MSDTQVEAMVRETLQLARTNAEEIRKIRREMRFGGIVRIIVWLIVAGVPVFFYLHLVKPPLENIFGSYSSVFEGK